MMLWIISFVVVVVFVYFSVGGIFGAAIIKWIIVQKSECYQMLIVLNYSDSNNTMAYNKTNKSFMLLALAYCF